MITQGANNAILVASENLMVFWSNVQFDAGATIQVLSYKLGKVKAAYNIVLGVTITAFDAPPPYSPYYASSYTCTIEKPLHSCPIEIYRVHEES